MFIRLATGGHRYNKGVLQGIDADIERFHDKCAPTGRQKSPMWCKALLIGFSIMTLGS